MIDSGTLGNIQQKVWDLGLRIGAPKNLLIVRGQTSGLGDPHIDLDDEGFHYIVSERGTEFSRKTVTSIDELLYILLDGAVSRMAWDHELKHRVKGRDPRRIAFPEMIQLMTRLDPTWGVRTRERLTETLEAAPYNDDVAVRRGCRGWLISRIFRR